MENTLFFNGIQPTMGGDGNEIAKQVGNFEPPPQSLKKRQHPPDYQQNGELERRADMSPQSPHFTGTY